MALSEYSLRLLGAYAEQPFLMAPMAGVTDPAYRIMCRRRGANLAYSEMVSVAGLAYASNKTWRLVLPADEEQQICVQLFGSKPDQFASAVAAVEERVGDRLSLIDINMACPARKVVTKGEGSALMRTPDLAEKIVEATVGAAHVPVTVKIRKGFYAEDRNAATFAQMLESAGAAAVAVHGRCATQLYTGQADWSVVDEVADAVEIHREAHGAQTEPGRGERGLDARVSGADDGNIKFSGVVGLHAFLSAISFKMARMSVSQPYTVSSTSVSRGE